MKAQNIFPKEFYQYAFKLGSFKTNYTVILGPNNVKHSKGFNLNYIDTLKKMYIEFNLDSNKNKVAKATYYYNSKTKQWDNTYTPINGKTKHFNAKLSENGQMVEYLNSTDQYGTFDATWTYSQLNDSVYHYDGLRDYNGYSIKSIHSEAIRIND